MSDGKGFQLCVLSSHFDFTLTACWVRNRQTRASRMKYQITCMCTVPAMWSWSISAYSAASLTLISKAVGVVAFFFFFSSWSVLPSPFVSGEWSRAASKERPVPCALLPPGGHWGEQGEKNLQRRFCLERLISPHPASKYHDCILGDSLPSAWKAKKKNRSLSTLFFFTSLCVPFALCLCQCHDSWYLFND